MSVAAIEGALDKSGWHQRGNLLVARNQRLLALPQHRPGGTRWDNRLNPSGRIDWADEGGDRFDPVAYMRPDVPTPAR